MSQELKRHLQSAGLTFLAGFVLAIGPNIADLSWIWAGKSAIFALLIVGVRGGLKPLWELSMNWALKRQS